MGRIEIMKIDRLKEISKDIYQTSVEHGWHEKKQSSLVYMCLVMSEVAEAVEADRAGLFGHTDEWKRLFEEHQDPEWHHNFYEEFIKVSREAEMADIVIRLLDYASEQFGDKMDSAYEMESTQRSLFDSPLYKEFSMNAWIFTKYVLNSTSIDVVASIRYIYNWAEQLGFDLDWHINEKMKYNRTRPYKHGGKKY